MYLEPWTSYCLSFVYTTTCYFATVPIVFLHTFSNCGPFPNRGLSCPLLLKVQVYSRGLNFLLFKKQLHMGLILREKKSSLTRGICYWQQTNSKSKVRERKWIWGRHNRLPTEKVIKQLGCSLTNIAVIKPPLQSLQPGYTENII